MRSKVADMECDDCGGVILRDGEYQWCGSCAKEFDQNVVAGCTHHWLIEDSGQKFSLGVCKHCEESREFDNSPADTKGFGGKPLDFRAKER